MGVVLNVDGEHLEDVGGIEVEEWIKKEIVKIITLYFDPLSGQMIAGVDFNAGDFIVSLSKQHIVLCTARGRENISPLDVPGFRPTVLSANPNFDLSESIYFNSNIML